MSAEVIKTIRQTEKQAEQIKDAIHKARKIIDNAEDQGAILLERESKRSNQRENK